MTKFMPFVFDEIASYTNQKCFIITGENIAFLTALLNSSLFKYCFRDAFPELQGGTREMSKIFFDKIPLKRVDKETNSLFEELVIDIQNEYTKQKAIQIDNQIFDIYNLSVKERDSIGFIEIQ